LPPVDMINMRYQPDDSALGIPALSTPPIVIRKVRAVDPGEQRLIRASV